MASMNTKAVIEAKPEPTTIDLARTAVVVVDMQNDFGAEGGMFHRAGVDISSIRQAIVPTALAHCLDGRRTHVGREDRLPQDGIPP